MVPHTPSLGELVDFAANESSKEFLGEGVVHDIACYMSGLRRRQRQQAVKDACLPSLRWWSS